jgi:aminopeptidase N
MEHQTMTTINDFGFYLVAHELAHQWFGDYITCGNWQDIWINEGFASYLEYIAAQELRDQEAADGWMANAMSISL